MCYTYDNWSFHFIWVIGMSYYQEGHIEKFGEVVKWKTFSIKTYILSGNWTGLQSKRLNSRTIHQTCLGYQLPKPFTGLVWSPTGLVRWTRPVRPRPASRGIYRTCSVPHQTCPVDQTFSRHRIPKRFTELVQSSDTSTGRFPPETIKGGLHPPLFIWPLLQVAKHSKIQILSSPTLSQASNPHSLFLREDLSYPLSEPPDSSKSTSPSSSMTSIAFFTLGDSLS
jgi:hypothetical protein